MHNYRELIKLKVAKLNAEPVTDPKFQSPRANGTQLQFLMQNHPEVEKPLALIDHAAATTGVEFPGQEFGLEGKALVGEFGTMAPSTHSPHGEIQEALEGQTIIGQKVIALDLNTGNYTDFISLNAPDLSFRPVGLTYNQDENALYLVTIGKAEIKTQLPSGEPLPYPLPWAYPFTGVVWKVTFTGETATEAAEAEEQAPSPLDNQTTTIGNATTTTTTAANATGQQVNQFPGGTEEETTITAGTEEGTTATTDGNGDDEEDNGE